MMDLQEFKFLCSMKADINQDKMEWINIEFEWFKLLMIDKLLLNIIDRIQNS